MRPSRQAPAAFTDPVAHPLDELVGRYARTHGPFLTIEPARRFDAPEERILGALRGLEAADRLVRGEFRPEGLDREWCEVDVLRQLRRRSLAVLRKEVEPVDQAAYARFLPGWQGVPAQRRGLEALVDTLGVLQGAPIPASTLETDVLPARVQYYRPADLDELCTSGDVVWIGAGAIGSNDGKVRLFFRDQLGLLADGVESPDRPDGPLHEAIRTQLGERGASFWSQLRAATLGATDAELLAALWDLVWAGEVTNDSLAPLRASLGAKGSRSSGKAAGRPGRRGRPGRLTSLGPPAGAGRWSLVSTLLEPAPTSTQIAHATALQLLERFGVVTREAVLAEGVRGGFAGVYGVLKVLEERGQTRRGYFVDGLGAAQFALPGAVDRLRSVRDAPDPLTAPPSPPVLLAATDPAQPYGAALAWPDSPGRPSRIGAALVVLADGEPLVWLDRRSHHLVTFAAAQLDTRWVAALSQLVHDDRLRSVEVHKVNGAALEDGWVREALRAQGFSDGYRGLVLRR
ncbi:MAG: hypothetical protein R2705_03255 [Ilumatobacteraceae bacterium]